MQLHHSDRLPLPLILDVFALSAVTALTVHGLFYRLSPSPASIAVGAAAFVASAFGFTQLIRFFRRRRMIRLMPDAVALYLSDLAVRETFPDFSRLCAQLLCADGFFPVALDLPLPVFTRSGKKYALSTLRRPSGCTIDVQTVLECCDRAEAMNLNTLIVSSAVLTDDALSLARQKDCELYDPSRLAPLLAASGKSIPEGVLESYLRRAARIRRRNTGLFKRLSVSGRLTLTGFMLTALSFTSPHRRWYLAIAFICVALAFYQLFKPASQSSMRG